MKKDNLGDRMKEYEDVYRFYMTKKSPIIVRCDGKAFHTFTKGLNKPFDEILIKTMCDTAKYICENVMNCDIAYTQSDEISLLLTDYKEIETQQFFNGNLQKISSVIASMATLAFNVAFKQNVSTMADNSLINMYTKKYDRALFDTRAFVLPKEEVCNYFLWRQQDATRNSIQMVAQNVFSHKELQGLSCNSLQNKLLTEKDINWNNLPISQKRGTCVVKEKVFVDEIERNRWIVDKEIPIFSENREYIDRFVFCRKD